MDFSRDEPAPQSWRPPSLASGRADRPAGGALRQLRDYQREVLALADWLRAWQVPAVVVEATGGHQKGPYWGCSFLQDGEAEPLGGLAAGAVGHLHGEHERACLGRRAGQLVVVV